MNCALSSFRDFEIHLRFTVCWDEDDIQLIFKQFNSYFINHNRAPGIYPIEDVSEFFFTFWDRDRILQIKHDDFSWKQKFFYSFWWNL